MIKESVDNLNSYFTKLNTSVSLRRVIGFNVVTSNPTPRGSDARLRDPNLLENTLDISANLSKLLFHTTAINNTNPVTLRVNKQGTIFTFKGQEFIPLVTHHIATALSDSEVIIHLKTDAAIGYRSMSTNAIHVRDTTEYIPIPSNHMLAEYVNVTIPDANGQVTIYTKNGLTDEGFKDLTRERDSETFNDVLNREELYLDKIYFQQQWYNFHNVTKIPPNDKKAATILQKQYGVTTLSELERSLRIVMSNDVAIAYAPKRALVSLVGYFNDFFRERLEL